MLKKENHIKSVRTVDIVSESLAAASKPENTNIKKQGFYFSPLLEGCMQLGKIGTIHKHHAQKELQLRNVACEPAD